MTKYLHFHHYRKPPSENGGLKRKIVHHSPAKLHRTPLCAGIVAKRCCLPHRRQAIGQAANLQRAAKPYFSSHEEHTFANAPGFRDEVPASSLLAQFPMDFGRIVRLVKP